MNSYMSLSSVVVQNLPDAVALFDAQDLRLLLSNPRFSALLDPLWRDGKAIGHPLTELVPRAEMLGLVALCRTVAATGVSYRASENPFGGSECHGNSWLWVLDPIMDDNGHCIHLLSTVSAISETSFPGQEASPQREPLQSESLTERQRLRVIEAVAQSVRASMEMNSISEAAVATIRANFETLYVYTHRANASHRQLHLLHISPVPPSGQAFRAVRQVTYDSSSLSPVIRAYEHRSPIVIEDLQASSSEGFLGNSHPLVTSGGRGYICVPLWCAETFEGTLSAVFTNPIVADGPEVQALVGCGTHLAAALAHARLHAVVELDRTRLQSVLDQLPDGVLIAESSTGTITYANAMAAHILGVPAASLVGHPFQAHPQTIGIKQWRGRPTFPWNYAIIRAFCGEAVHSLETVVTRPDGRHVFTLSSSTPLRTANGDITEAILVFQDITESMSLEQHKSSFLSMASHELRTPVTAIQGFAELLQQVVARGQGLSGPLALRAVANIVTQSEVLSHLIEEMLDLSRIEQAYLSLSYASHDLIKTLTSLVEMMGSTSRRHHLHLVLEGRQVADQLLGWFDERRIIQVLSNLVSNAIKYTPAGGEIEVGLRWTPERPEEVLLWVRDEGIGIAKSEIAHIFTRFYRASTLDPSMSGLGIGLYLVKDLITRHGGRIWVKSVEGQGSTFFVVLPLNLERNNDLQSGNEQSTRYNR